MIMICAGSGLAPFRGFIQERLAREALGDAAGPTWLFFGCDHPDVDLLYRDELEAWQDSGAIEVFPAFYRLPVNEVTFVQHRVWYERERVADLIDRGATVFVCGDGKLMAPAVRETIAQMHSERTSSSMDHARTWIASLETAGRYVTDVYG